MSVVKVEFYNAIKDYLADLREKSNAIHSLEDIIKYNIKHAKEEGGIKDSHQAWASGQDIFELAAASKGAIDDYLSQSFVLHTDQVEEEGIDAALMHEGLMLDGLLVPSYADGGVATSTAAKAGTGCNHDKHIELTPAAAYPMISIPVGLDEQGVPVGLAMIQKAWQDQELIKSGSAIEDLLQARLQPQFLNLQADNYIYDG